MAKIGKDVSSVRANAEDYGVANGGINDFVEVGDESGSDPEGANKISSRRT